VAAVVPLVLSIFPGIGILDRSFEEHGFTVVRGPDLLWGGDIKRFHVPAGKFDGVIGGPPCQSDSQFSFIVRASGKKTAENLKSEFERVCAEAAPRWFLMEGVKRAEPPIVSGYNTNSFHLNNRHLGAEQYRVRSWHFGVPYGPGDLRRYIQLAPLEHFDWSNTVLASGGMKPGAEKLRGRKPGKLYGYATRQAVKTALRLQGLPEDFFAHSPFTVEMQHRVVGNGVPMFMGRALAAAVKSAMQYSF
jgi:DNA (cytosine-5)-methyltransferase 1